MLLANCDLKITYVNPASLATLQKIERHLPVAAENVLGSSIDIFHKNPAYQRKILSDPKNLPVRANINIGPETADLLVTAIYDRDQNYLGPMVTWELITQKLENERKISEATERERQQAEDLRIKVESILEVVNAASRGDLTREFTIKGADAVGQMSDGLAKFFTQPARQRRQHCPDRSGPRQFQSRTDLSEPANGGECRGDSDASQRRLRCRRAGEQERHHRLDRR